MRITSLLLIAALTPAAAGQSRQIPAPPQQRPVVVTGATVHPITGPSIDGGYVAFENGRITAVGGGAPPGIAGAEVVDATGLHLYPGLISSDTMLGLIETGAVSITHDFSERGEMTPEVRAAVAVNPDTDLIPVARANGILTAMVFPRGGILSGRASVMRLDGWTWEAMAIEPEAGLVIQWPRTEPDLRDFWWRETKPEKKQRKEIRENLEKIDRFFDDAEAYSAAKDADESVHVDLRYEATRDALAGRRPVYLRAQTQGQIESAVAWAVRRDLKAVIVGGREADRALPLLVEHDVPVIVGGVHRLPRNRDEGYDEPFELPAKLHEAGVRFAIASGSGAAHERNLNHNAATAVAFGLPRETALRAVTITAARILGVEDALGSIETGKAATLILTTGDPLQITTDTVMAFIDGRRIDLGSRHKAMYEKYRTKYEQMGLIE